MLLNVGILDDLIVGKRPEDALIEPEYNALCKCILVHFVCCSFCLGSDKRDKTGNVRLT